MLEAEENSSSQGNSPESYLGFGDEVIEKLELRPKPNRPSKSNFFYKRRQDNAYKKNEDDRQMYCGGRNFDYVP